MTSGYLVDTSVFIAAEQGRALVRALPAEVAVSVVTLAELEVGVLVAEDADARATRLGTLLAVRERAMDCRPTPRLPRPTRAWPQHRCGLGDGHGYTTRGSLPRPPFTTRRYGPRTRTSGSSRASTSCGSETQQAAGRMRYGWRKQHELRTVSQP